MRWLGAPLNRGARRLLLAIALAAAAVLGIAGWIDPYDDAGRPLRMGSHRQLGLPPCTFYAVTGLPCPSCGMTTSFALFVHGDVSASTQANAVGTLLAAVCCLVVPTALISAGLARWPLPWSPGKVLSWTLILFAGLMLARWCWVLAMRATARF